MPHVYSLRSFSMAVVLATMAAACQDPTTTSPPNTSRSVSEALVRSPTNEFPAKRVSLIALNATGPFVPGLPILVTASVASQLDLDDVDVRLLVVDDEAWQGGLLTPVVREAEAWRGALARGLKRQLSASVVFPRAGYYRVQAVARNRPAVPRTSTPGDTTLLETTIETLWILVDQRGGRLTDGYTRAVVDSNAIPRFGAYGPFLTKRDRNSLDEQLPILQSVGRVSQTSFGVSVSGLVRYTNHDFMPPQLTPVPGAEIEAFCMGKSDPYSEEYDLIQYIAAATSATGTFGINCDAPYEYVEGTITLRNQNAYAAGPNNSYAGTGFAGFSGSYFNLTVANEYAARVFVDLSQWIPAAVSSFARSRPRMYAEVSPNSPTFGIFYCQAISAQCPSADMIRTNYTRVFSGSTPLHDGLFVTLHEYGHAFHYTAIEPWASYACNDSDGNGQPEHFWTETDNLSCAFVEGFADFFAMWLARSVYGTSPYGGDYGLENNLDGYPGGSATNPPLAGDGVRVEAAVAAFLYDLVDASTEPDGINNQQGAVETFDALTVPASWIASVMQHCRLNYYIGSLNGPDELVYCLEGSPAAYTVGQSFSSAWRSYSAVTFDQSVGSYSASAIRSLWRKNLYGVYP